MRYLTLIGFAICRFSFAQIANSPMSISNIPTAFTQEWINTSPIQFNQASTCVLGISHQAYFLGTDLSQSTISFAQQSKINRFTAMLLRDGSPDLSYNVGTAGFSKKLSDEITAGLGGIASHTNFTDHSQFNFGYQIFGSFKVVKNGQFSVFYQKIGATNIQSLSYNYGFQRTLFSGSVKFENLQPTFEASAGFSLNQKIHINTIIGNGPYVAGLSILYRAQNLVITGKLAYHYNQMGYRPTIYIYYVLHEQKSENDDGGLDVVRKGKRTD